MSVDASWFLLAVLISWTLAGNVFPVFTPGLPVPTYWTMSVIATTGLLLSIVLHETAHSFVARHFGMPIRGITLFIFGGVAEMTSEPNHPRDELLMAAAGPAASFVLAGILYALLAGVIAVGGPTSIAGTVWYLGLINLVLALFNLVPAFPLDGGRMFRAVLWWLRGDMAWATRIAAGSGNLFGALLIVLGLIGVLQGDLIGGIWRFLIGLFLRGAATASYGDTLARRILSGIAVTQVMNPDPIVVAPTLSVQDLIDTFVYRYHHRWFPVVDEGRVIGSVATQQAASVDRPLWTETAVEEIMRPVSADDAIAPETTACEALMLMRRTGHSRLLVVRHGTLLGVLSSRDLLQVLAVEEELRQRRPPVRNPWVPQ